MTAGIASLNLETHRLVLASTAVYGCGFGLVIPATNLWVAENAGPRRSSALSLLNLSWSAGSLACPLLILWGVRTGHLASLLFGTAGAAALLGVSFLFVSSDSLLAARLDRQAQDGPETKSILAAIALGLLFFLYIGTENGVSGWAAAYSKRLGSTSESAWELAPMFFWAGLLLGRLLAPLVLSRVHEIRLVVHGLAAAGVGVTMMIRANVQTTAMVGITTAGLGLSIVYPIFISWLSQMYGARARRIGGAMFALGGAGGAALPWLVGVLSNDSGSLRVGLLVPLAGCAVMLGTAAWLRRRLTN
jgi:fucose permease